MNRAISQYANKLGYKWSNDGIVLIDADEDARVAIDARTEFDVYSFLGLRFIAPQHRCLWAGGSYPEAGVK